MNYEKYIEGKVIITLDGERYGKTGTLIDVVKTEWLSSVKMAHIVLENGVLIVVPVNKIIIFKENE